MARIQDLLLCQQTAQVGNNGDRRAASRVKAQRQLSSTWVVYFYHHLGRFLEVLQLKMADMDSIKCQWDEGKSMCQYDE